MKRKSNQKQKVKNKKINKMIYIKIGFIYSLNNYTINTKYYSK